MGHDLDAAAVALPLAAWEACGLSARPLVAEDLESLAALGSADQYFAWERQVMTPEYYRGLLQFRLGHYWRYGFGIHGLWRGSEMVGQAGLQVLDEEKDRVEFVVFLGTRFVGKGIGTCLARTLAERCKAAGMEVLYGVVRSDNPEGKHMVEKISGTLVGRMTHFHREAGVYSIRLNRGD